MQGVTLPVRVSTPCIFIISGSALWHDPGAGKGVRALQAFFTSFEYETASDFFVEPTRVCIAGADLPLKHVHAPALYWARNGDLLLTCRWDTIGHAEGDASNEQALFFSRDNGQTWKMGNYGRPIVNHATGTSFKEPSPITHAFVHGADDGTLWLYYSVNQPYTWGQNAPSRATAGGEIRRIRLIHDGRTWTTTGESQVVWGFMQPLPDGRGGTFHNVRVVALNKIIRLANGHLLMPVAGRTTVSDPKGAFWKLNRCWVLESEDGGRLWTAAHFIGGNDSLCLAEPTIVETAVPGHVVCLMRSQYETGNQLFRSESTDFGRTWSSPVPTGLPNANTFGSKPFLTRLHSGDYLLLQTNEHCTSNRTNLSLFLTDEEGLHKDRWMLVKTLSVECRDHWEGASYGWAEETGSGDVIIAYVSWTATRNYVNVARVGRHWIEHTVVEPNGVHDIRGDHIPRVSSNKARTGTKSLRFTHTRGRAIATQFGRLAAFPMRVGVAVYARSLPKAQDFRVIHLACQNGRHVMAEMALRGSSGDVWIRENRGWIQSGVAICLEGWNTVWITVHDETSFGVEVNGVFLGFFYAVHAGRPDTFLIGGSSDSGEACEVYIDDVEYSSGDEAEGTRPSHGGWRACCCKER